MAQKEKEKPTTSRLPLLKFDWEKGFRKMRIASDSAVEHMDFSLCTFFFRGTKEKKLNRRLKSESSALENLTAE